MKAAQTMKQLLHSKQTITKTLLLAVLAGLASGWAATGDDGSRRGRSLVMPPSATYQGKTYAEWSAEHWKWVYSLPVDQHPLFDTAEIGAGQPFDHVWFLGGTYTATPDAEGNIAAVATREITIPAGTALFFPVVDVEASVLEGNGTTEAELRATAEYLQDHAQNLTCTINGRAVLGLDRFRVQSPLFTIGPLPDNNVFQATGYTAPEGTTTPSVSDGVFVMVNPLPVGHHTLRFGGALVFTLAEDGFDFTFSQDITYHVTVQAKRGSQGHAAAN
jgi:hypothetical protein